MIKVIKNKWISTKIRHQLKIIKVFHLIFYKKIYIKKNKIIKLNSLIINNQEKMIGIESKIINNY